MTSKFKHLGQIDFPVIDSDAHVVEPPDTWVSRMPAGHRDRAPRLDKTVEGDVWSFDRGRVKLPLGLRASAGRSFNDFRVAGARYEEILPGNFELKARLADMEADGVHAQVLFPGFGMDAAKSVLDDAACHRAIVRAYNEWLRDWIAPAGGRLVGLAIMPRSGIADCVAELRWAIDNGLSGVILSAFPSGKFLIGEEDDRFWSLAQEADMPVCVHIGSFFPPNPNQPRPPRGSLAYVGLAASMTAGAETLPIVCDFIFSGLFGRFPRLRVLFAESGIGWIPTLLEQADNIYLRLRWVSNAVGKLGAMPSQVYHRNCYATFISDRIGILLRVYLNMDHIMWSTDYPHTATTWPNSTTNIEAQFAGLPMDLVRKLLHSNCKAFYRMSSVPESL